MKEETREAGDEQLKAWLFFNTETEGERDSPEEAAKGGCRVDGDWQVELSPYRLFPYLPALSSPPTPTPPPHLDRQWGQLSSEGEWS